MKSLLCFAHGRDRDWEAICLDLDIAVQGESFAAVQSALNEAIQTYVMDAMAEDTATSEQLLNRAAPWYVRLKHLTTFFYAALFFRDDEQRHAFNMPCPA